MNRLARIIVGLAYCLIINLIIFRSCGLENGTLLAAESSGQIRKEMEDRLRVGDEEDLHWKIMTSGEPGVIAGSGGHSISHGAWGAIENQIHDRGVEDGNQGLYDQAIAEFTKCLQGNPRYFLAYYNRGTAYAHNGQYDLALVDFSKNLEGGATDTEQLVQAFHNRGIVYMQKGQYDRALADFNQALKIDSRGAEHADSMEGVGTFTSVQSFGRLRTKEAKTPKRRHLLHAGSGLSETGAG